MVTAVKGRLAIGDALEREEWATQREQSAFLTWLALSWKERPGAFQKQVMRRKKYLEGELTREKETLRPVLKEVGHEKHEAVWAVSLMVEQLGVELKWLRNVERELQERAKAKNSQYATAWDLAGV